MADSPSRNEIEAQIAASEACASNRLAEVLGKMRVGFATLGGQLDAVERAIIGTKATVIATGIAAVAVVIAVPVYGQTWFGIGISSRDVIGATVTEMRQASPSPNLAPAK